MLIIVSLGRCLQLTSMEADLCVEEEIPICRIPRDCGQTSLLGSNVGIHELNHKTALRVRTG